MTIDPFVLGKIKITTTEQKKAATRKDIEDDIGRTAQQLVGSYNRLMAAVYRNRYQLTPQEVASTLTEEESIKIRTLAILVKSMLNKLRPGLIADIIPEVEITLPANIFPEVE